MTTISRQLKDLLNSTRKMFQPNAADHKNKAILEQPWPTIDFPTGELPEKPSELIFTALRDLRACENDPLYMIDMGSWHTGRLFSDEVCAVCLAGSTMAKSLDAAVVDAAIPNDFGYANRQKLRALNYFRVGHYERAIHTLNARKPASEWFTMLPGVEPDIMEYEEDPELFFEDMVLFAWDLHNRGQ